MTQLGTLTILSLGVLLAIAAVSVKGEREHTGEPDHDPKPPRSFGDKEFTNGPNLKIWPTWPNDGRPTTFVPRTVTPSRIDRLVYNLKLKGQQLPNMSTGPVTAKTTPPWPTFKPFP